MRATHFAAISIAALAFALPLHAQTAPAHPPAEAATPLPPSDPGPRASADFSADEFRAHVTFLADDLLEGRESGQRGHEIAARYVATQMLALGLRPGNGDSWFQQVTFGRSTPGEARLSIGRDSFTQGQGISFRGLYQTAPIDVSAPLVFVGHGIDAAADGHDDYRGLDVRGKIVVMLAALPQGLPSDVATHLQSDRLRMAAARGAIGMIIVRTAAEAERFPMARMRGAARPSVTWLGADGAPGRPTERLRFVATVDPEVGARLFVGAARSLDQVNAELAANRRPTGFALRQTVRAQRTTTNETFTSPNVIGIIPGSDPALAGEYVLLMAHLDHIGIAQNAEAGADRINNGAMDNASGVATLLEVARQFMRTGNRPRRPILIAAVTAEERGLLGSSYLSTHPVVGNGRVVGVVNLDMPILTYNFTNVTAFGAEHSTIGEAVARASRGMGVATSPDPLPEEGLFARSDHYTFVQAGVPAVFLMTGFANGGEARFRDFLARNYHSVRDQSDLPFDWNAGARFAEINYRIAREVADAPQAPRWYRGSFFGDTLGGDQPRATRPAPVSAPRQ